MKKKQGYNARLDESLGNRCGKESTKKQEKSRRDESKGTEKYYGKRAYSAVKTMDKGGKSCKRCEKTLKVRFIFNPASEQNGQIFVEF